MRRNINGKQLSASVQLIEIALRATHKSPYYEVNFNFTGDWIEFLIYRNGEIKEILMWQSLHFGADFDEQFEVIYSVLSHLELHGVMPDIYPMWISEDKNELYEN